MTPFSFRSCLAVTFLTLMSHTFVGAVAAQEKKTAPPAQAKDEKIDLTIKGELKASDPKDKVTKNPFKIHEVKLRVGHAYIITLDAADKQQLDPFLRVEDSAGKELASDDDDGGFPNAKLVFFAPKDDTYKLIATAYEGTGAYTLRVRTSDVKIYEVAKDGLTINGKLAKTDPPLAFLKGAPHQVFHVKMHKGQSYVIDLVSKDFDAFLILEDSLGKRLAFDDDSGGDLNARLNFNAPADDVYRLLAATFDQKPGNFQLRVRAGQLSAEEKLAQEANRLLEKGGRLYQQNRPIEAIEFLKKSVAMYAKLHGKNPDGHPDLARSLNNLGFVLDSLGQPSKALPYYERALAMNENLHGKNPDGHPVLADSLNNMGYLLHSLGQPSKALAYHERALAMREKLFGKNPDGNSYLAQSLSNLGSVLQSLGEPSKALPYLERALAIREKLHGKNPEWHPELATSLNNLGSVLGSLGEPSKALPFFERALAIREKLHGKNPKGHPELATSLNNLGSVLNELGQPSEALPYHKRALAMFEKLHGKNPDGYSDLARSLNNLGFVLDYLGQPSKALPYYERALAMQRGLIRSEVGLASEAEALDFSRSFPRTPDRILSLARVLPKEEPLRFYAQIWESKAFLSRILARRHEATRIALAKDEGVRKTWEQLQETRRELAGLFQVDPSKVADRDERIRSLTDTKEKLEADLARFLPETARSKEMAKFGPKDLADRLPSNAVLLDFIRYQYCKGAFAQGQHYVVFVVGKGQPIQRVDLGLAAPIDKAIATWRKQIQAGGPSQAPGELAKLWNKITPALPKDTRTIYLAPDGDLARLPFAALPGKAADTVLLEDYHLVQVPHAPFLLEQLLYPPSFAKTSTSLLAVGDVPYDLDGATKPWKTLKFTGLEVNQLVKMDAKRATKTLSGQEATVANVLSQLPQAGYAHFATHGFFAEELLIEDRKKLQTALKNWEFQSEGTKRGSLGLRHPLSFTGIVLAGANGGAKAGKDAGILSSEAIVDLPLEGLRLTVLSACETGLGELTEGEGVQGLQRAFHLAGCPNVMGSLWNVNDSATAALMNKFYHELWVTGKTPAEALRSAQLTIYRHPDRIPALAGERGRPDLQKAAQLPETPIANGKRADTRLWSAFVLSGLGN